MATQSLRKRPAVIKEIEHLCSGNNLIDIWRQLNPQLESLTWRNKPHKTQCRLDFFLISEKLADLVTSCKIFHAPETDHSAISLHLQAKIKQQDRGPGFWKFNNLLLRDETYVNELRMNMKSYRAKYESIDENENVVCACLWRCLLRSSTFFHFHGRTEKSCTANTSSVKKKKLTWQQLISRSTQL